MVWEKVKLDVVCTKIGSGSIPKGGSIAKKGNNRFSRWQIKRD